MGKGGEAYQKPPGTTLHLPPPDPAAPSEEGPHSPWLIVTKYCWYCQACLCFLLYFTGLEGQVSPRDAPEAARAEPSSKV